MEMKMIVVCNCGTKLRVAMANYLKMRCPRCGLMLAVEIERQAARNSKAMFDVVAYMLHERMTAKRWRINDEAVCQLLAKAEVESHGGEWPPRKALKEPDHVIVLEHEHDHEASPLNKVDIPIVPPPPPPIPTKGSIRVKVGKRAKAKGRK
jgi:hypothetical protein